ncbi:MAG: hypothetical protein D6696_01690 [Acidobacteria bacterium]|nr:MAG: hypothetical protein D6696_01690 [Acidobacteriota bacterium]
MGLSDPPRRRLAHAGAGLALLALGSAVGLALAEGAVRLLRPQPLTLVTPGLYQSDPPLRYRLAPGYHGTISNLTEFTTEVEIDRHGMRGPAIAAVAAGPRLLVLGDSFTFGWGVENDQTFVHLLATGERPFVAMNGGVPGYGLPDEADWFERYGKKLRPDLVLLAVFAGNDLLDATAKHRRVVVEDGLVGAAAAPTPWRRALDRLHLVRLAKRALPPAVESRLRAALGLPEPWATSYLRDTLQSFAVEPPPLIVEGRAASRQAFDRLRAAVEAQGAALAVVLVPAALQVDERRWRAALTYAGGDPAAYDPATPSRFFAELAASRQVPVLDLLPAFRAARNAGEELYFQHDPHWNAGGHRLAASALARFLAAGSWRRGTGAGRETRYGHSAR